MEDVNKTFVWVGIKRLYILVCVTIFIMTSYMYINNIHLNLQNLKVIGGHVRDIVYPDDFLLESNIRSAELVSTWNDNEAGKLYCDSSAQNINSRESNMYAKGIDNVGNFNVRIILYDELKVKRKHGGDVIMVWAERRKQFNGTTTTDRVAGVVQDHLNGTYSAKVKMLWGGTTIIKAKVAAKSGVSCLRLRSIKKYGNSVFSSESSYSIHVWYEKGTIHELTQCSPTPIIPRYETFCNFTSVNFGQSWYCGKPKNPSLNCSDAWQHVNKNINKSQIIPNQPREEVINTSIVVKLESNLKVEFLSESKPIGTMLKEQCRNISPLASWVDKYPTGYLWDGHWRPTNCISTIFTRHEALQCLKGKVMRLVGDSTIRQYVQDIASLLGLPRKRLPHEELLIDPDLGINIRWTKHEMPYCMPIERRNITSSVHEIRVLADDDSVSDADLLLGITYNAHLMAFSASTFRSRIMSTVAAIKYLLYRKPGAKTFIKGPHIFFEEKKWFDARMTLLFRDVIFEELRDLMDRVIYLDTLSISIAHGSTMLHRQGSTLRSQTEQLLSYIC